MADDKSKPSFDELSPEAQEAVTPRGEYLHPEDLDQGTGYEGAPKIDPGDGGDKSKSKAKASSAKEPDKPKADRPTS